MSTRSILISYAGYPYTPSSLMPDNGLANLAGALIEAGHETLILDYGTVDSIARLYPHHISDRTKPIYRKIFGGNGKSPKPSFMELFTLKYLNRRLEKHQERVAAEIAGELIEKIGEFRPDFIGFKLWNGDGFTASIRIGQAVKRAFPSLKIFGGGPQVDYFKEHIYRETPLFDALIFGEGEHIMPLLSDYSAGRAKLSEIPNIIYKDGARIRTNAPVWIDDLNSLPFPAYDSCVYPGMAGNQKIKIIVIDESRGCPHRCAFCIQPIKSGSRLRLKSPQRVVDEIGSIVRAHGVTAFRYAGSTTPLKHAVNIANAILRENLKITYSSFGHIQKANGSDFELLKASGCYAIFFGIESGSREVLQRAFGKNLEPSLVRETLIACRKAGIFTVGSMIFPAPFETDETEKESLDLLFNARPDSVPVQFPGIVPETGWGLDPGRYNFRITSSDYERVAMRYKIKFLYPPAYWAPLPYRVNGMSYRQFTRKTDEFARKLDLGGILTHVTDDLALMALHAGYKGKERAFRERLRFSCVAGDVEFTEELVNKINGSVVKGIL